ncbi:M15 family metallopeptidase [Leucobacter luti]|uniref:D-alanyl-D-alanine carboxypeptidase-like protein n=1 Tax=Leucobacter luti TaxID=340320 RepID=A0A4Q7TPB9_9MICO|nr:M15 family metallopeptidase [Leucobacter luti]MBL3700038.1 peptidase M15 [Leucobacter luti]RZT62645.1 D-alanyl-D-alanine carboxypeptidase-like protein [Leucobacter luti]
MRYESRGLKLRKAIVPGLIITGAAVAIALIAGVAVAQITGVNALGAARGEVPAARTQESNPESGADDAGPTEADGALPEGTSVWSEDQPGVTGLAPGLLEALRAAATEAEAVGFEMTVTSGWRSAAYQERLLTDAVTDYGSAAEAARWVATPETSAHVAGEAVDVGPWGAADWLAAHGQQYGLCQIYDNEPWHFELRPDAPTVGCPTLYWDPTYDPRLQS